MTRMPPWVDAILVPLISLLIAFFISGLVIWFIGENPFSALGIMVEGAVGSAYGWGYTLYYATNFMFTGLAVAVAFHASQFNIGGEGQATLGGLGVALMLLFVPWPHWTIALLAATIGAAAFGAAWALIPAWLQAKRGSHIVITTIMFNFIAFALMNYILNKVLKPMGTMDTASARFPKTVNLPSFHDLPFLGGVFSKSAPANVTFFVALLCAWLVWLLLWRTRLGYMIRAFGKSEPAAVFAGISPVRIILIAMLISGALAGMMAINGTMGGQKRLILNAVEGAGFIGIAVSLMGRNHPLGVVLASILFGFLYQGGAELSLAMNIPSQLITVIQALVILFTGALDNMVRMPLERLFLAARKGTG
jgi:simple sugar transport system permease protein